MKKKQLLAVISIVGLLMVAFFWNGANKEPIFLEPVKTNQNAGRIDGITSSDEGISDDNQDNKHNEETQEGLKRETLSDEGSVEGPEEIVDSETKHGKEENINTDISVDEDRGPTSEEKKSTCTLLITCEAVLDNMHLFDTDKPEMLPEDGIIYKAREVILSEGESVFDILLEETRKNKIHMEFAADPISKNNYVKGINNLYEFDCGGLSGWRYRVNGQFPSCGCNKYIPQDGDIIEWVYTCDLGND